MTLWRRTGNSEQNTEAAEHYRRSLAPPSNKGCQRFEQALAPESSHVVCRLFCRGSKDDLLHLLGACAAGQRQLPSLRVCDSLTFTRWSSFNNERKQWKANP